MWKSNIVYNLNQDPTFSPFMKKGLKWTKVKSDSTRDLAPSDTKSAQDRAKDLEQMLGCIANFCTVIARNSIIYHSKDLDDIWQKIRLYYGFHTRGVYFIDFSNIKLEAREQNETISEDVCFH